MGGGPAVAPFSPEHFQAAHAEAVELLPALRNAGLTYKINGIFSFTPDGMPVLGESLDVRGFWVAEAVWITHAGGVGQAVAEWMAGGTPGIDLRQADINRFPPHARAPAYLKLRAAQQYREVYDIIHPAQQITHPRNLRLSPFHPRLQAQGGVFFETAGWERAQWFEANQGLAKGPALPGRAGWAGRHWSPVQGGEHQATRERVAMCDLTAFTKIEVSGRGAAGFLQWITSNQVDRPVGRVAYTSMLDKKGGIQCDLTVTRLDAGRFLVLTGTSMGMHDLAWIRSRALDYGSVQVTDVTSKFCGLGLWGPGAREVLQRATDADVSNEAFPYFTARRIWVDLVPALALRVSCVGELGWEIYASTEYGLKLWDTLWEAGRAFGVIALGGGAFDSLRLEKGYRLWGVDMHSEHNPFEAGLGWAVRFDKGDFLGREALIRIRAQGLERKLCCLTLDEPEAMAMGGEPILDGRRVLGYVTSSNYGYTVRKQIAYGYLPLTHAVEGTPVGVEYFGRRFRATVSREPLYDARRLRS